MGIPILVLVLLTILLSPLSCLALHQQHEPSCPVSTLPTDPPAEQPSGDTSYYSDAPQELLLFSTKSIDLPHQTNSDFNNELLLRFPFVCYAISIPPQNRA